MIEALRSGDPNAFTALVKEFQSKVVATCYRFTHSREDAEDVAQEVFIEIHKSISRFREESSISTWIYRIAVTKSLDYIRKKKRKKRYGIVLSIIGLDNHAQDLPAPSCLHPDAVLEQKERASVLQKAVDSLPENQRVAITLSQYESFNNKEVADIMNTTVSAVESLLHRAKKNLHKKLYNHYENRM